ncbi:FAD-binding protein [Patescibacteria group bacterium]
MSTFSYDVVIIGGGATGLRAALEVAKTKNVSCAVVSKLFPLRSQTCMAQGGMNAALNNHPEDGEDTIEHHFRDTVKGGEFLNDQDAVEYFCEQAPECVIELEHMGMVFSRNEDGTIAQRPFGGGMFPRTCFARDYTGHILLSTLLTEVMRHEIPIHSEWHFHSLIVEEGKVKGILALDMHTAEVIEIKAKSVVIATGGAGNLFQDTVNATSSTGDGVGIAYRAGVPLKDIEFIQFHPTSLAYKGILVTEAARGENGYLINNKGERFMKRYAPEKMELASRDVVAQAIQQEIDSGHGVHGAVLLDLTHLGAERIKKRLPQVYKLVKDFADIDCTKEAIPVRPAAHYLMGGIDINKDCETSVKGLYAAGECSCMNLHGANRLGGNSLMETVVFGKRAGEVASLYAQNESESKIEKSPVKETSKEIETLLKREKGTHYSKIKHELTKTLEENAGIFRSHTSLTKGLEGLYKLREEYENVTLGSSENCYNYALYEALELRNLLDISRAFFVSAEKRKESRGAHARKDFPLKDNKKFHKHSLTHYQGDDDPKVTYKDVTITSYPLPIEPKD